MQKRLCLVRIPPPLLLFFANKRENFAYRPYLRWWWSRPGLRAVSLYQCVCVCYMFLSSFLNLDWGKQKERKGIIIKRDFDAQYFISVGVAPLADNVNLWVARPSFLYPVTALFIIIFFLTFSALWIVGHLSFSLGGGDPYWFWLNSFSSRESLSWGILKLIVSSKWKGTRQETRSIVVNVRIASKTKGEAE